MKTGIKIVIGYFIGLVFILAVTAIVGMLTTGLSISDSAPLALGSYTGIFLSEVLFKVINKKKDNKK